MRQLAMAMVASAFLAGCGGEVRGDAAAARAQFVTSMLQLSASESDLGAVAARRGSEPAVRGLGAEMLRDHRQMQAELVALARRKGIIVPSALPEARVALRDNLAYLVGQVYDNAYALAMVEDLNRVIPSFKEGARSTDPDVAAFAQKWLPALKDEQSAAGLALKKTGGSPFGFVPK